MQFTFELRIKNYELCLRPTADKKGGTGGCEKSYIYFFFLWKNNYVAERLSSDGWTDHRYRYSFVHAMDIQCAQKTCPNFKIITSIVISSPHPVLI